MLTPREYAKAHDVSYTGVLKWLKLGLLEGVERQLLPYKVTGMDEDGKTFERDAFVFLIPADAPRPMRKPGPVPAAKKAAKKGTRKGTTRKRGEQ